jgi:inosose dehydratase
VAEIDPDIFAIVEQDLYPTEPSVPLPIATRTREHILASTTRARRD